MTAATILLTLAVAGGDVAEPVSCATEAAPSEASVAVEAKHSLSDALLDLVLPSHRTAPVAPAPVVDDVRSIEASFAVELASDEWRNMSMLDPDYAAESPGSADLQLGLGLQMSTRMDGGGDACLRQTVRQSARTRR